MENTEGKPEFPVCDNDVSMDGDSANLLTSKASLLNTVANANDSQLSDDGPCSEKESSRLSSSSGMHSESKLQSNEITSESLTVSQDSDSNGQKVEVKTESCGLAEMSLSKTKDSNDVNINKLTNETECTSEQSECDDHISSSELTKNSANENSTDVVSQSVVHKRNICKNKDEFSEQDKKAIADMDIDVKANEESADFEGQMSKSLHSEKLSDNVLSDNAVDNTAFDDKSDKDISLIPTPYSVNESSLLDKEMDSTTDSHILEHDLKLSDDSSDNLVIIDEESATSEVSKSEKTSKELENDVPKSFENLVKTIAKDKIVEVVPEASKEKSVADPTDQNTSLEESTIRKKRTLKKGERNKKSINSESDLESKISSKKDSIKLTISVRKDSDKTLLSNSSNESASELKSKPNVKRKCDDTDAQNKELSPSIDNDVESKSVKDKNSISSTSLEKETSSEISKVEQINRNGSSKRSNKGKTKEPKLDISLPKSSDNSSVKGSNSVKVASDLTENKLSSIVNTSETLIQDSSLKNLLVDDASNTQEKGTVPLRTPRNKVKKRPYSPEMTPPSVAKSSSSSVNKSSTSNKPPPTPVTKISSPASAPRKKSKKYNEEDVVVPFKSGWMRELVHRATTAGKARASDVYYFTPEGGKLRSMPEILKYLSEHEGHGLTSDNFTFAKETIYRSPFERERDANVKSNITTTPVSSKASSTGKKKPVKKSIEQSITVESPQIPPPKFEDTPSSEKSSEKTKTVKSEITSVEKPKPIPKSSEKRSSIVKSEPVLEKRKAEPELSTTGTRKNRLRSIDSTTSESSAKDSLDKTEHRSKSAKLSSDSSSTKPKKSEPTKKAPIIKVKFTKTYSKPKTTPKTTPVNIRGTGGDIEDDLQQILTTSVDKSIRKVTDTKSKSAPPSKISQRKKKLH